MPVKIGFRAISGASNRLAVHSETSVRSVGQVRRRNEKNIAEAFEEARNKKAMLILDEADSFLQDRRDALRSWKVKQVNEMLTQMENHSYPFVCTTNLMDRLDTASLRRFIFKIKYDYLTDAQKTKAFKLFFDFENIVLREFENLTPADFALVAGKTEILDCLRDEKRLISLLMEKQNAKILPRNKIGF